MKPASFLMLLRHTTSITESTGCRRCLNGFSQDVVFLISRNDFRNAGPTFLLKKYWTTMISSKGDLYHFWSLSCLNTVSNNDYSSSSSLLSLSVYVLHGTSVISSSSTPFSRNLLILSYELLFTVLLKFSVYKKTLVLDRDPLLPCIFVTSFQLFGIWRRQPFDTVSCYLSRSKFLLCVVRGFHSNLFYMRKNNSNY